MVSNWKIAVIIALLVAASSLDGLPDEPEALCHTDAECSILCDEWQLQLPPDHPAYCDGGPQ